MKFMISWRFHQDKIHNGLKHFSQMTKDDDKKDAGDKINVIGRWHDVAGGTGVVICECDDAKELAGWAVNWNSILNINVVPVLDDDEVREVGKKKLL